MTKTWVIQFDEKDESFLTTLFKRLKVRKSTMVEPDKPKFDAQVWLAKMQNIVWSDEDIQSLTEVREHINKRQPKVW